MKTYGIYGWYNLPNGRGGWDHYHATKDDDVQANSGAEAMRKFMKAHPEIEATANGYNLWAMVNLEG